MTEPIEHGALLYCPRCEEEKWCIFTETKSMKHYGKFNCSVCGRWIEWLGYPDGIGKYLYSIHDVWYMNFGKHRDKPVIDVIRNDYDYIDWMIFKGDFPEPVIDIICDIVQTEGIWVMSDPEA